MSLTRHYRQIESEDHLKAHLAKGGGVIEGGLELRRFHPVRFSIYDAGEQLSIDVRNIDTRPAGIDIYRDVTEEEILAGSVSVLSRRNLSVPSAEQMPKIDRTLQQVITTREAARFLIDLGW